MATKSKRVRLNLFISKVVRDRLDGIMRATNAESLTEVIRKALALYEEYVSITGQGGILVVRMPNGDEEKIKVI